MSSWLDAPGAGAARRASERTALSTGGRLWCPRLLCLLLLLLLSRSRSRSGPGLQRQVPQKREPHARDGEVARRLRAVRQRLLEQQPRLREIGLRRNAFAIAYLIDPVRALRLLRGSLARAPPRVGLLERVERHARVQRRELTRLPQARARFVEPCLRNQLVALDPAAG